MALKGVIQGPGGTGGGQLSGSGVTSVGLVGPAPFITGPAVTSSGNLTFDFSGTAIPVAEGGTGANNFTSNAVVLTGPSSTAPLTSVVLPQQSSEFLNGMGVFAVPAGGGGGGTGTVTSVDFSAPQGFTVSGNPITTSGVLNVGRIAPDSVAFGGTGVGTFTSNALIQAGLSSTGAFRSLPLNQQTSTFLDGTGTFRVPVNPGGTVQSVALAMTSEFSITGSPILGSGTLNIGFTQPLSVAHGGTGMGSFGAGPLLGGLTSTSPIQGLPNTGLTSTFLRGDGVFGAPPSNPGTVTSVALLLSSELAISGSPITGIGTLTAGWVQPLNVGHGGTGLGSVGIGAVLRGGLTSTAPFQGTPLTNLTSTFLDGTGNFSTPPTAGGAGTGTVTSVALQLSSEFNVTGSPVTTSGTLMGSWAFQNPNLVFAGPTSVSPSTPSFRRLISGDIPQSLSGITLTSSIIQNPTVTSQLLPFGSTVAWNMNSGTIALLGMDSTVVGMMATPANLPGAGSAILRIMQLGTGLPTIGWSRYWKFESGVKPTLSSGFGNIDVISLYMESGAGFAVARKNFS